MSVATLPGVRHREGALRVSVRTRYLHLHGTQGGLNRYELWCCLFWATYSSEPLASETKSGLSER